jgi:drug/metabolite transporter (DMT)-like permease
MVSIPSARLDLVSGGLLGALAIVWGCSFFFAEIALRYVPPLTITLYRVAFAVPVLYVMIRMYQIPVPKSAKAWGCYAVMGALNNAVPFSLIFWGQTHIGGGLASILNATTAVTGAVVAGLLLADERLTGRKIMGGLLGLLGVAVIMGLDLLVGFNPTHLGQLAILGAGLSYAFAGVWARKFLSDHAPIANAFGMLVCSSILMGPVAIYADGLPRFDLPLAAWGSLLGLAVLSTALAYILFFEVLARAGSANALLVTLLIPPVTITLTATVLDETLDIQAIYGFGMIAIGLIVTDGRVFDLLRRRKF